MSEEEGRKRLHRVRMQGAAIAPGTSKEVKRRAFTVLDEMTYLPCPQEYTDGKGGLCERLFGRLSSWFKFKPGHDERREKDGEYRIVFRPEIDERDDVSFITVQSIGGRDNVYDNKRVSARRR